MQEDAALSYHARDMVLAVHSNASYLSKPKAHSRAGGHFFLSSVYIRIILKELGHKQLPTPLQTNNAMADAVINGKIQLKQTKAIDMQFHWLRDCECQQQFRIYWQPGKLNYAHYWTKHHPESHHHNMRKEFLTSFIVLEMLQIEQQHQHTTAARAA
jgi:hypothetical protein